MIKIKTLKNKIRLVTEQIPYVQSAAIGIFVNVGAVIEDETHYGISHFIEHMMFKGTEERSAKQIAADFDKLGAQFNAFTGKEMTCYHAKTISANLLSATEILVDMITNSQFDQKELDKERKVIFEEIKMTQDVPDELGQDKIIEEVFKGNPLGNSILGTPESLMRINHDEMKAYYQKNYARDHIIVAIAGNFDQEEMEAYLEAQFMNLPESRQDKIIQLSPYSQSDNIIIKDIEQSHIFLGIESISLGDDLIFDLGVLSNLLGGSMSSRLFQHIREQKGLAYSVFCSNSGYSNSGAFLIYAGVAHEKIKDAITGIKSELTKLRDFGVTDEEINMAKQQIKSSYIFGQENVTGRMVAIGKGLTLMNKILTLDEYLEMVDNVSKASIQQAIDLITEVDDYCKVLVTNKEFNLKGI